MFIRETSYARCTISEPHSCTHTHAKIDTCPLLSCVSLCTDVRQPASFSLMHKKNIPMDCFGVNHLCRSLFSVLLKKTNSMWPQAPPSSYSATSHWTGVHHKPLPLSVNFDTLWITIEHLKKSEAFLRSFWIERWALISYCSRLLCHKYDIPRKFKTLWSLCVMLICHSQVHRFWSIFAEH